MTRSANLRRAALKGYKATTLFFLTEQAALKRSAYMSDLQGIDNTLSKVVGGWNIEIDA